jgi:uncharacterized protein HemX
MFIIISIIILFVLTIALGAYKAKKEQEKKNAKEVEKLEKEVEKPARPADCCGIHEVCDKESLLAGNIQAEYYDDEELDALACTHPSNYTEEQIAMLREVFHTLNESDVEGWLRSLEIRHINLPDEIKEEAMMIVRERRG